MATKKATLKPKTGLTPQNKQTLRKWNIGLAVVFALQAIVITVMGGTWSVPLVVRYLAIDTLATDANKHQVLATASHTLANVRVTCAAAIVLLLFALVYLLLATYGRARYEAELDRGVQAGRWAAGSTAGAVGVGVVALVSGLNDLVTIVLMGWLTFVAASLVVAVESLGANRPKLHRSLVVGALLSGLLVWAAIVKAIVGALLFDGHITGYLWAIYASLAVLTVAVIATTYMRWHSKGRFANLFYAEKAGMILAFAMPSVLAWLLFAGAR